MLITQISDCHIAHPPAAGSDRTGDLQRCVDYLNQLDPLPDLVVHTGDIAHDGKEIEYAEAAAMLDRLRTRLAVVPGNRDNRARLRNAFSQVLAQNCHEEFVQYAIMSEALCVIMLDTMSPDSNKGRLCEARLAHLQKLLAQAKSRAVAIFMHHPPFEIEVAPVPFQFEQRSDLAAFAGILQAHANVEHIFCGHSHRVAKGTFAGITASTIPSTATDLHQGRPAAIEEIWPSHRFAEGKFVSRDYSTGRSSAQAAAI